MGGGTISFKSKETYRHHLTQKFVEAILTLYLPTIFKTSQTKRQVLFQSNIEQIQANTYGHNKFVVELTICLVFVLKITTEYLINGIKRVTLLQNP